MYIITYTKNEVTYTIHDPRLANSLNTDDEGRVVSWAKYGASAAKLTQAVNSAGSLTFTVQPEHNAITALAAMEGTVKVTDGTNTIFLGRIFRRSRTFTNAVTCECEGALAYLNDSIGGKYNVSETASEHMTRLLLGITKVKKGNCTVTQSAKFENDDVSKNVWTCFVDDLTGNFGGYLIPRYDGDTVYIDYLATITNQAAQKVEFAVNLLDVTDEQDGSGMYNCVQPYGKDGKIMILSIPTGWYNRAGKKVDEGADDAVYYKQSGYVMNVADKDKYGLITIGYENTEITTAEDLFADAIAKLNGGGLMPRSIKISAVDLSDIKSEESPFRLATAVQVNSTPHDLTVTYPLTELEIDLLDPVKSTLTLGQTADTVSGAVAGGSSGGGSSSSSQPVAVQVTSVNTKTGDVVLDLADVTGTELVQITQTDDGRGVINIVNQKTMSAATVINAVQFYALSNGDGGGVIRNASGKNAISFTTNYNDGYSAFQSNAGAVLAGNSEGEFHAALGVDGSGNGVLRLYNKNHAVYATLNATKIALIGQSSDNFTKLWENTNPTAAFAPQTVAVALESYRAVVVTALYNSSYQQNVSTLVAVGHPGILSMIWGDNGTYCSRTFSMSESGVAFQQCYRNGASGQNSYLIPTYIFGVK